MLTARSGLPSPLKSATVTSSGLVPAVRFTAGPKVPSPLPKSTLAPLAPAPWTSVLVTARSSLPSRLKSASARPKGLSATVTFWAGAKVPSPLPNSTLTVLVLMVARSKSGLPSPLTSPTAEPSGGLPTVKFWTLWNEPLPLPRRTLTVVLWRFVRTRSTLPSRLKSPDPSVRAGPGDVPTGTTLKPS